MKGEIHSSAWSTTLFCAISGSQDKNKAIWGIRFQRFEIMNHQISCNLMLQRFVTIISIAINILEGRGAGADPKHHKIFIKIEIGHFFGRFLSPGWFYWFLLFCNFSSILRLKFSVTTRGTLKNFIFVWPGHYDGPSIQPKKISKKHTTSLSDG